MPTIGCADARAYVIADPLHTVAVLLAGKDVQADLRPTRNAFGEFERLMLLMIGRNNTANVILLTFRGEVRVQFSHQCLRRNGVCAVNLDLIVSLCYRGSRAQDDAIARTVLAASLIVELRIVEHHHESSVHVILLMAVQESLTRIVGHKLYLDGSTGVNQDDILCAALLSPRHLQTAGSQMCAPVQMNRVIIHALVFHDKAITLSELQQKRVLWR